MDFRLEMIIECLDLDEDELIALLGTHPQEYTSDDLAPELSDRVEGCYRAVRILLRRVDVRWAPTVSRLPSPTLSGRTLLTSLAQDPHATATMLQEGFTYSL